MHTEPWVFVVAQDRATLTRISDRAKGSWVKEAAHYRDLHPDVDAAMASAFAERLASPDFCVFYDASTLIAIGAKPLGPFVVADCWLAAETPDTKSELGIPRDVDIIAPIVVGVASEPATELSRRNPTIVCWTRSA